MTEHDEPTDTERVIELGACSTLLVLGLINLFLAVYGLLSFIADVWK